MWFNDYEVDFGSTFDVDPRRFSAFTAAMLFELEQCKIAHRLAEIEVILRKLRCKFLIYLQTYNEYVILD